MNQREDLISRFVFCGHYSMNPLVIFLFAFLGLAGISSAGQDQTLWYRQPAERWLEALPVGNGRVGAMVFGGVTEEKLALNEVTFWSGAASDQHENPAGRAAFGKIRELFKSGKYDEAQPLVEKMLGHQLNFGTCLPAGDLLLAQDGTEGELRDYRRELNLDEAEASVTFVAHGVKFRRELIASHPSGLLVLRLTADRPGAIAFTLRYQSHVFPWTAHTIGNNTLVVDGHAFETVHSDGKCGVGFQARFRIVPEGGTVTAGTDLLRISGADAATVLIALNTDYQGRNPDALCAEQITAGRRGSWRKLHDQHVADYQRLFRRVAIDLGGTGAQTEPTDARLNAMRYGAKDPQLAALFFQYARYLTIAGSREDSPLPMNLQGIWNDGLAAAMGWTCDYHLDINTQQNYWPAEEANLSESCEPLFHLVESLQAPGHHTAHELYGIDHGWVCHVFTDAWGFTAPGWGMGWGLHVVGGAWIATHLWEHYQFTGDREFLARQAYPVLKGAGEFFLDYLYPDPATGYLVTGPSVSPERGGETQPGCMHDREILYALFSECIAASQALDVDAGLRERWEAARAKLPPYKIGHNGQLQEWHDNDDGGETGHRHISHLVGLFPLDQINPQTTPQLAAAARKSLELRMQNPQWEDVEWSAANAVCYYARLGDGALAHQILINLLKEDSDTNLMTFSRGGVAGAAENIFAIDGNMAGAAGIAEMLLQSSAGEIELLPALPNAWPNGKVTGLRARGGFTVDMAWKNHELTSATLHGSSGASCRVRYASKAITGTLMSSKVMRIDRKTFFP
jgi:alpha-L-fucosidase 2